MRVRFRQDTARLRAVRLGRFRSTVRGEVFYDCRERRDRLGRSGERSSLRCVLVVKQDRGHVKVVPHLV
jgi:hypothetical protein